MIRHVILWKFKENTEKQQAEFLQGLRQLYGVIPEIMNMEVGVNSGDKENYDACLIADFADFDALHRYAVDPRHQAVAALCKEIRISRVAADYEV